MVSSASGNAQRRLWHRAANPGSPGSTSADNSCMQLLIPYAYVDDPGCTQALATLHLPVLDPLLARLTVARTDTGSADTLTPPHERALAQAIGITAADGLVPWAASAVARSGRDPGTNGWAWITPAHWQVGADRIQMTDPATLQLSHDASQTLLQAMAPYFAQDGIELMPDTPGRWLARGDALTTLATASLDRVIDADVGPWMPATASMRRLQNEMQMLLYTHPVNDARSAQGLASVNSFWVSGSGAMAPNTPLTPVKPEPAVADALRPAALRGDWTAWAEAWRQLDQGACQKLAGAIDRGQTCELVLCSERNAIHFTAAALGWRERLQRRLKRPSLKDFTALL